jgi:hypothetical protein
MRRVLVLHDVEGYTHEEIGEVLGVSSGTSKSQLSKARSRMREILTEEAPPPENAFPPEEVFPPEEAGPPDESSPRDSEGARAWHT